MGWDALLSMADRAVEGEYSQPVTYAPNVGAPVVVSGIFDAAYVRAAIGTPGVSTSAPQVFFKLADLPVDPLHDDPTITIGAVHYEVVEVKPDSVRAGVVLVLREVV